MEISIIFFVIIGIIVGLISSFWILYNKAGESGWKSLIPIYNLVILLKIINKPVWWIILLIIPLVNIIVIFMINIALAKSFCKGTGFGIGLVLLPFIFVPLLAFGDSNYIMI
tara:strand:- start:39 stop:374 length:336 start_codon:yes stop_codon:yes gene_type:complete